MKKSNKRNHSEKKAINTTKKQKKYSKKNYYKNTQIEIDMIIKEIENLSLLLGFELNNEFDEKNPSPSNILLLYTHQTVSFIIQKIELKQIQLKKYELNIKPNNKNKIDTTNLQQAHSLLISLIFELKLNKYLIGQQYKLSTKILNCINILHEKIVDFANKKKNTFTFSTFFHNLSIAHEDLINQPVKQEINFSNDFIDGTKEFLLNSFQYK